jgi:hypothetical protein
MLKKRTKRKITNKGKFMTNLSMDWNALKSTVANIAKQNNGNDKDERFWSLTRDESGVGTAVIRLVPGKGGNSTPPIVRIYKHEIFIKKPTGKWGVYKNTSPSTIGQPCPVGEAYVELKNSGVKEFELLAAKIGRRTQFISNAIIVNDLGNPSNNGQLKLWGYGKTVFDQILSALEPSEQQKQLGVQPKNLFNLMNGEEIVVSVSGKKLDTKYTLTFNPPKPYADEATVTDIVMNKAYDLTEFIDPNNIKDYETLRNEFARAIADTDIEKALLKIGSKVITKPYSSAGASAQTGAAINIPGATQPTTQTATQVETAPATQQVVNNTTTTSAPQPTSTPVENTVASVQPQTATQSAQSVDSIEDLLNDL